MTCLGSGHTGLVILPPEASCPLQQPGKIPGPGWCLLLQEACPRLSSVFPALLRLCQAPEEAAGG